MQTIGFEQFLKYLQYLQTEQNVFNLYFCINVLLSISWLLGKEVWHRFFFFVVVMDKDFLLPGQSLVRQRCPLSVYGACGIFHLLSKGEVVEKQHGFSLVSVHRQAKNLSRSTLYQHKQGNYTTMSWEGQKLLVRLKLKSHVKGILTASWTEAPTFSIYPGKELSLNEF